MQTTATTGSKGKRKAAATGPSLPRTGSTNIFDTHVGVWEEDVDEPAMRLVFLAMLDHLRLRGWHVEQDPGVLERHPSIADGYWVGHKGDLRMYAETGGRHSKAEFYQELHVENPNGGRYDFDKFSRMPRTMQLQCVVEITALARMLVTLGYTLGNDMREATLMRDVLRAARRDHYGDPPLVQFNKSWEADRFKRDETGWPCVSEYDYGSNKDRDGIPLRNGETRYFRQRGRLLRGTVYTNMNNMWMVVLGGGVTYEAGCYLFHCDRPDMEPRRLVSGQAKRVRAELEKALKAGDYQRVAKLAKVCQKLAPTG